MRMHTAAAFALLLCVQVRARPQPDPAILTSDFTPPRGAAHGFAREGEGAWQKRLMTAVSTDGLTFSRTNEIITDQPALPASATT